MECTLSSGCCRGGNTLLALWLGVVGFMIGCCCGGSVLLWCWNNAGYEGHNDEIVSCSDQVELWVENVNGTEVIGR